MEQDMKRNYEYRRLPDNIRQIGESSDRCRIYIEDYVLTYIRKIFQDKQDDSIVVFIGCEGKEAAVGNLFIYGAVEMPMDSEHSIMQEEQWDMLFHLISEYFPYGRIMGWGCGVGIWNSEVDYWVRKMQEEQFAEESSVLFLADLSEREEKVFVYSDHAFEELSGYFVYYERNPQMQEYMLREQPEGDGFESDYEDEVTQSIRTVIQDKQNRQKQMHYLTYGMACLLLFMILAGGSLLVRSLAKINSLEETIETLSDYVAEAASLPAIVPQSADSSDPVSNDTQSANKSVSTSVDSQSVNAQNSLPDDLQPSNIPASAEATSQSSDIPASAEVTPQSADTLASAAVTPQSSDSVAAETASSSTPLPLTASTSLPLKVPQTEKTATVKSNRKKKSSASTGKENKVPQAVIPGGVDRIKQTYIVRKGDTLSQIVWKQYHSFAYMDRVQRINQIEDTDRIYVGQCILLPDA